MPTTAPDPARLRAWTYHRQRLDRSGGGLADTLRGAIGVYSSHPSAPLALLARTRAATAEALAAMEAARAAVRLPAMRGSIFLLPTDTAARVTAATRLPPAKLAPALRWAGLDGGAFERLRPRLLEAAATPVLPAEVDAGPEAAEARIATALRLLAHEGRVLRVSASLRTDQLRYVATEAWLGRPLEEADPDGSLAWLAGEYLRAFGPARARDLAWWAGVTQARAKAALAAVRTVDAGGGWLLREEDADAFAAPPPVDDEAVALLPKWDPYTMAHAPDGRDRLIDARHLGPAYSRAAAGGGAGATTGDGMPMVLRGGKAVALWTHRFERERMRVTLLPLPGERLPRGLDGAAFEEIARLLSAASLTMETRAPEGGAA